MKQIIAIAFALLCVSQAHAQSAQPGSTTPDTPAAFFANDPARPQALPNAEAPQIAAVQTQSRRGRRDRLARIDAQAAFGAQASPVGGVYALVDAAARRHGVPVNIARATVRYESRGRCNARGSHGELGPLQIKPSTARGLGFSGPASALATCGAGLEWGMKHLALALRKCGHVGPHNYGLGGGCARTAYVRRVMGFA